eukprot:3570351-Pleurochrysis_carterae.AAC.1
MDARRPRSTPSPNVRARLIGRERDCVHGGASASGNEDARGQLGFELLGVDLEQICGDLGGRSGRGRDLAVATL